MTHDVTVLIADDHPLLRHGLREFIGPDAPFTIVAEASNGEEALREITRLQPDIAVLDIDMPRMSGLETMRAIRDLPFPVKVIILTMYDEEEMFNAAMDLGAMAYVLKDNAATDVVAALASVARGEPFVSSPLHGAGQRRSDRVRQLLLNRPQIESLTPAERRILKFIAEDLTSKEIAARLKVSVRTVENHRQHICNKLHLHGTHSLLKFAFDNSAYF
jgi:DNA-binding NarL/FixJ family response regulator